MRALLAATLLAALLAGCAAPREDATPTPATAPPSPAPPAIVREDTQQFTLGPRQNIEWKLRLEERGEMDYEWSAQRPVYFDFHGDRDDGTDDFVSHKEGTLASDGGSFVAPFEGRHGWYFSNGNAQTVTITLTTLGDYEIVGRTGGNAPP